MGMLDSDSYTVIRRIQLVVTTHVCICTLHVMMMSLPVYKVVANQPHNTLYTSASHLSMCIPHTNKGYVHVHDALWQ